MTSCRLALWPRCQLTKRSWRRCSQRFDQSLDPGKEVPKYFQKGLERGEGALDELTAASMAALAVG